MTAGHSIANTLADAQSKIDAIDAEALLSHILKKDRSYFRAWPERELEPDIIEQFGALVKRRHNGEPLAYLLGWREFWSLQLQITPDTLIPRPETELLVEEALKRIPENNHWRIADLGTGSGAIALAIASERPNCNIIATDISPAALAIAQANAKQLNLNNVTFKPGDWTTAFEQDSRFEMIVSNPPYVDADDPHLQQNGLPHEPQTALTPGSDGLAAIRTIISQARPHLKTDGWLLLEHGYHQGSGVRKLLTEANYTNISTIKDLSGQERLTLGSFSS